jgi:GT2 family glycosyltransferase
MENKNITYTVIIPVHTFNDNVKELLNRAVNSITEDKVKVLIVVNSEYHDEVSKLYENSKYNVISSKETKFTYLVNEAVKKVKTKYFSILEFDDVYTEKWFKNCNEYIKNNQKVSIFLPLTDIIDYKTDKFLSFGNEAPWANTFTNTLGFIDIDALNNYFAFNVTGAIINKEDFEKIGGLKNNIKLSFWYEFLLRAAYNNLGIFVIPKIGYKHYINREDSLFDYYQNNMTQNESRFWFNVAKEEYYYNKEREIEIPESFDDVTE